VRSTPITLLARRSVKAWSAFAAGHDPEHLGSRARAVLEYIKASGASFFDEIAEHVGMLPVEAEEALAELVALGMVNSDSFGGLRALLMPSSQRGRASGRGSRRKRHMALFAMADAGRWALVRRPGAGERPPGDRPDEESIEHVVRTLLRRWGVIFWRLLAREAAWLPPWRDIVMCCRRLEARGEIRGGRFVAGFSGEQYAAPEAVAPLREARRRPHTGLKVSLSGADPLNLMGLVTPGARLPSLAGNRILYRDGLPIATYAGGEVQLLEKLEPQEEWEARNAVLRRHVPASLIALDDPG
jgi:ATP-dependent Lhr-like helicase